MAHLEAQILTGGKHSHALTRGSFLCLKDKSPLWELTCRHHLAFMQPTLFQPLLASWNFSRCAGVGTKISVFDVGLSQQINLLRPLGFAYKTVIFSMKTSAAWISSCVGS